MARIIYPALQAPVLTPAQDPETTTFDRWGFAWSEPVRLPLRLQPGLNPYPALDPVLTQAQTPEKVSYDRWNYPWSEPVRQKPGLAAAQYPFHGQTPTQPFQEVISVDKWFEALSEPVRFPRALPKAVHNHFTEIVQSPPFGETILVSKWFEALSEPVRLPAGLKPYLHSSYVSEELPIPNPAAYAFARGYAFC